MGGVVGGAEGDVVDASCARAAVRRLRIDDQVDVVAEGGSFGGEALPVAFFGDFVEAEDVEEVSGAFRFVLKQRDAEEAADGVLCGDVGVARGDLRGRRRRGRRSRASCRRGRGR